MTIYEDEFVRVWVEGGDVLHYDKLSGKTRVLDGAERERYWDRFTGGGHGGV